MGFEDSYAECRVGFVRAVASCDTETSCSATTLQSLSQAFISTADTNLGLHGRLRDHEIARSSHMSRRRGVVVRLVGKRAGLALWLNERYAARLGRG